MAIFKRLVSAVLAAGTAFSFGASPVLAQSTGPSASGVRISPTRAELTVAPAESGVGKFMVKNVTSSQVKLQAELNDFEPQEDGTPKPLKQGEHNAATLKDIATMPADILLEPGQEIESQININVPSQAAPGAYYGLVLYKALPVGAQGPGQVSLTGSVAGIVLVNVPGKIFESMQLSSIRAGRRTGKSAEIRFSNVFAQPFDNVQILLKNTGNSFIKPYGKIIVKNMQGSQIAAYELNDTDPKANVLPGSKRGFTTAIGGVKTPGRYSIEAAISYGNGGDVLTQKVNVWYLPVWLVAAIVLLVAALVFGALRVLKRKSRR